MTPEEIQSQLLTELEGKIDICVRSVNWLIKQIDIAKAENTPASRKRLLQLKQKLHIEKEISDKYAAEFDLICGN